MYNPQIKNRYALVDLAKYGTKARKHVHSDVLIGDHPPYPIFKEGDLLDANATFNLIQDSYDQGRVYEILSSQIEELENQLKAVERQVSTDKRETQEAIDEIVRVHNQDIQNLSSEVQQNTWDITDCNDKITQLKNYVDRELDAFAISNRFVYDGREENLFVIK